MNPASTFGMLYLQQTNHVVRRFVDQSNQLIEVFRVLDDVNASCDKQEMEQLKQRQDNPPGVQPRKRK